MSDGLAETPLITPERLLRELGIDPAKYRFTTALLSFMPVGFMAWKFGGKRLRRPLVPMAPHLWVRRGERVLLVGPIYGGPVCAAVLEELSSFGVQQAIAYGLSGSLKEGVTPRQIVVANSAFCSDGTSREYTDQEEVGPDLALRDLALQVLRGRGVEPELGRIWTTDALYREFPSKVAYWRERGAGFVDMEAAPFYAVAQVKGIKAVLLSVVSDSVGGGEWSGWSPGIRSAVALLWKVCLEMVDRLQGREQRTNPGWIRRLFRGG